MGFNPLISIIIPLYNGANYVEEAILCAINQTYNNKEIIVVNDGSTDNGAGKAICDKYVNRITYFEKPNGGCSSALNYGIRRASGDFISWLSHDDLYRLDKLEKQVELYTKYNLNAETVAISSCADLINSNGKKIFYPNTKRRGLLLPKQSYNYLLFNKCFNGCGLLIPKRYFFDVGFFNEDMRFVLDWNLWLKFALGGMSVYMDDTVLVSNRCHSAQITVKQKQLHVKESKETVEELFDITRKMEDKYYLKQLYYFCYSTNRDIHFSMRDELKSSSVKISRFKRNFLRLKLKTIIQLKRLYRRLK